jgi:putative transposase
MPNHIHVLGAPDKFDDLRKMFQSLHRAYTEHFRKKYNHVGHLWQGRFRSGVVNGEIGARECLIYIEQNPVRANMVPQASDYLYSSASERLEWINGNIPSKKARILNIY